MFDKKHQLIQELIDHLEGSQGDDLMNLVKSKSPMGMDDAKGIHVEKLDLMKPKDDIASDIPGLKDDESSESPAEEAAESPMDEAKEDKGDGEMTDEELAQLLKEYIK